MRPKMSRDGNRVKFAVGQLVALIFLSSASFLNAAEKLNTSYISVAPNSSAIIWVTKEMRLFEKYGFDATIIFISGSIRGIQAILAGEIPIGEGGGPGLTSARLAGGDVIAIAGNTNVLPYYLVSKPSIRKAEDLRGKVGGNHIAGTTAEFALRMGLKKMGLNPGKDVQLRVIGGSIERMVALQKGIVDFTVVTEAGKAMAEKIGFPMLIDMATLEIPFPQNGIYTSTRLIKERPEMVRRYVKAYTEGIHYFKTHKEETLKILQKYSKVEDRKVLDESWSWQARYTPDAPYPPLEGYQTILDDMAATNPKAIKADAREFIDTRFVKELEDSGFIKSLYRK